MSYFATKRCFVSNIGGFPQNKSSDLKTDHSLRHKSGSKSVEKMHNL